MFTLLFLKTKSDFPSLSASVMSKIIIKKNIKKDQPIMKNSTKVIEEKL